jgi:molecular chaperone HtpG
MTVLTETFQFQAETKQLLDLMIHSLYTSKEIFLRELISNASDALDRLRFDALLKPELMGDDINLEIRLATDREARTLTVSDNGIGMSRDEVITNIGTIAQSGTRKLREKIKEGASEEKLAEMIGQFGVGFYSSFMVADRVSILTRSAGEETATLWESDGQGQYTLSETHKASRGTAVTLHLKAADPENGIEDFTDKWVLSRIVKRYSDFISYPIVFKTGRDEAEAFEASAVEDEILNSQKPIWSRPQSELTESEYTEFYKYLSHDLEEPLHVLSAKAEGLIEYQSLVFIPAKAPFDLYYHAAESGLRLYARGVLVMETCPDLLPRYLRFIKGLVDCADLPLNISRQMLQQERQLSQIRKWLTKKILDALQSMHLNDEEKYLRFWGQFGRAMKEGVGSDYDNKDKLVSLLLFESSQDAEKLSTLASYVSRMKEGQQEIFYITGESRSVVEHSPHLEAFKAKGYEVLFLVDPVDELVVQYLPEYEGKKLKSISKGTVKLGNEEEQAQAEKELKERTEETSALLQYLQKSLDEYIKEVRLTNRLTTSPVCLVGSDLDYSPQMERLLQMGTNGRPKQRRIMELNPDHEVFAKLLERFRKDEADSALAKYGELLLGYAMLAEGSELPDRVRFNSLISELITQTL